MCRHYKKMNLDMQNHNQTDHIPNSFNANPKSSFTNPEFFPFRPETPLGTMLLSAREMKIWRVSISWPRRICHPAWWKHNRKWAKLFFSKIECQKSSVNQISSLVSKYFHLLQNEKKTQNCCWKFCLTLEIDIF